ncbi:hypothetical protein [Pseudomonas sp. RW10S2]|uniref:hypothetical protein n=1 Tax=Pseudomonas sp. RW10S2 TaxID=459637 RepID=UPI0016487CA1|nr:hypothetical protein [Pseudomonas sp. RW10S2]MBC3464979.1 hypothetical protein [Pseudomonas sp. RW10S2]
MPWYKVGTVAVTAGQTTVTGTGTNFTLNARAGDGFVGPDGLEYEIANVPSSTALSILPAYRGVTVSAGSYVIKPMQGYPKDLADRVKLLVDQWGATLASLGTVATENIVPVSKGGTGATTQADARTNLGLVRTASPIDSTAGRLLGVGDHGLGGNAPARSTTALSTLTKGGTRALNGDSGGLPSANTSLVHTFPWDNDTSALRLVHPVVGDASLDVYLGKRAGSTEYPLRRLVHSGNIVGTATQASGVPTGAIIERGANASGNYTKYADGTLECWGTLDSGTLPLTSSNFTGSTAGVIYFANISIAFPAAFAGSIVVIPTITSGSGFGARPTNVNLNSATIQAYSSTSTAVTIAWLAKGRWY